MPLTPSLYLPTAFKLHTRVSLPPACSYATYAADASAFNDIVQGYVLALTYV